MRRGLGRHVEGREYPRIRWQNLRIRYPRAAHLHEINQEKVLFLPWKSVSLVLEPVWVFLYPKSAFEPKYDLLCSAESYSHES